MVEEYVGNGLVERFCHAANLGECMATHTLLACQLRWVAVKAKTQRVGLKIAFRKPPLVFIWV